MKASPQVEAATARYIDSLGPAALQKAHDYTVGKEWMLLWGLLVAAIVTWLIVRSGLLDRLAQRTAERRNNLRAFLMLLAPVLFEPLFNKYEPVPPGQVRDAVVSMAQRAGIPPDKVYMFNGSRQSNNFTANAGGVGNTARVAISDVALKSASLDEVRAVTGHEIGHYVLKHTWWGILIFSIIAVVLFWLADRLFPRFARAFGTNATLSDPRGIPVLVFLVSLFGLLALPFLNTFARTIETQADLYSLQTENRPDALASALVKTAEYRYPRPNEVEEVLFYDHPSVERRVRMAMEWKAAHPEPPTQ